MKDGYPEVEHDEPCVASWSSTGLCPCCGCEVESLSEEQWRGEWDNILVIEYTQYCPVCEWESDVHYDAE